MQEMPLVKIAFGLLIGLLASHGGYAYPNGPPTSICNTSPGVLLRPGAAHGVPQSGNGDFLISTDLPVSTGNGGGYNYAAGELYTGRIVDKHMISNQPLEIMILSLSSFDQ